MRDLLSLQLVFTLPYHSTCTEGLPFTRQLRSSRAASRLSYSLMRSSHGFNQSQQLRRRGSLKLSLNNFWNTELQQDS
jgi:hypothetical protein